MNAQTISDIHPLVGHPVGENGYEKGVSGCFAGIVDNYLMMAGGCNFPEQPAADGGEKRYYRGIYAASLTKQDTLRWNQVGELPAPVAYGAAVETSGGLILIGGCNECESLTTVYRINIKAGEAVVETLPSLPFPMDNFIGARHGKTINVYGGKSHLFLHLDNVEQGWTLASSQDVERIQPVGGYVDGQFHVWGGFSPKKEDADAFIPADGLRLGKRAEQLPAPRDKAGNLLFGAGGAMVSIAKGKLFAVGGVHEKIFLQALNEPQPDYMTHPVAWYQFNPDMLIYDKGEWKVVGNSRLTARAGSSLVAHKKCVYVIDGELKPGVRTPEILRLKFKR